MHRRAVERAVQIVSEAAKALPPDYLAKYPKAPWTSIVGIGNILRHEYQRLDDSQLWEIATVHLPQLQPIVAQMLTELGAQHDVCSLPLLLIAKTRGRGVWVPACAGTTSGDAAPVRSDPGYSFFDRWRHLAPAIAGRAQSLVEARDSSFQSAPCFCQFIRMWRLVALFFPSATDWLSPTQWNRTIAAGPTTRMLTSW